MNNPEARLNHWRQQLAQRRAEHAFSTVNSVKSCGHPDCALNLDQCCACIDARPQQDDLYFVYVDGEGLKEGFRWSFYCDACKDKYRAAELDSITESDTQHLTTENPEHARRRAQVLANYQRVFGSREEIEEVEYESPITSMFTRAWSRYRDNEAERRSPVIRSGANDAEMEELAQVLQEEDLQSARGRNSQEFVSDTFDRESSPAPLPDIDLSDILSITKPAPAQSETLVNVECKICFSQVADMLLLPCAHLILCEFCLPVLKLTGPRDLRRDKCPVCRTKVIRSMKIYR